MSSDVQGGWGYRPAIDGLRTVAVYLVVLFHAGVMGVANGFIGVDLFFVLSGYLVTNVMLAEHRTTGRISLRRFYARRVRRLLPAALVVIVGAGLASLLVLPQITRGPFVADARASLLYVANWHFLADATDYFAAEVHRSPFLHFWSLAIEEQFYVVYPLVLIGLLRLQRATGRRGLAGFGLAMLAAVSLGLQVGVGRTLPLTAYYGTHTRLYQLLAGALLAIGWVRLARVRAVAEAPRAGRASVGGAVAALGLALLVLAGTDMVEGQASVRGIVACGLSLVVIAAVEAAPGSFVTTVLGRPAMTYLGRISYGIYLWHWPLIVFLRAALDVGPWTMAALAAVGGTALAALSFQLLETPIRRSPRLDPWPRAVVAGGLACSVLVAALVVAPILRSDRKPSLVTREVPAATGDPDAAAAMAVTVPAVLDTAVTDPGDEPWLDCDPATPSTCVLADHGGPTLLVVGDSNAMVLLPVLTELAGERGFTLVAATQVGCPWELGLSWVNGNPERSAQCTRDRAQWYDTLLPAVQPDVVLAVTVPRDPGARADGSVFVPEDPADPRPLAEVIDDSIRDSVARFTDAGAAVVLVEPLPYDDEDPTACLSGAAVVGECAYEANSAPWPSELTFRALDAERDDVAAVDMDRLACPFLPWCVPLADGELVFRNQFHLSNQWLLDRADDLWALLSGTGLLDGF